MQSMYYIGLDVHKSTISYCVKDGSGTIHAAKNQKGFTPVLLRNAPGELLPS
jgi:hypothetical protein